MSEGDKDDKVLHAHARPLELDEEGRVLSPKDILARGLLTVGRRLLEERQLDVMAGAPHRPLDVFEQQALEAATQARRAAS